MSGEVRLRGLRLAKWLTWCQLADLAECVAENKRFETAVTKALKSEAEKEKPNE